MRPIKYFLPIFLLLLHFGAAASAEVENKCNVEKNLLPWLESTIPQNETPEIHMEAAIELATYYEKTKNMTSLTKLLQSQTPSFEGHKINDNIQGLLMRWNNQLKKYLPDQAAIFRQNVETALLYFEDNALSGGDPENDEDAIGVFAKAFSNFAGFDLVLAKAV